MAIVLAEYIGYYIGTSANESTYMGLLGIAAFFLWAYAFLYFVINIAVLFFPKESNIQFAGTNQSKITRALYNLKSGLFLIAIISTFIFSIWFLFHSINRYEFNQLVNYGEEKRVEVKKVFYGKHKSLDFEFEIDNTIYEENLPLINNYLIGDTIEIIVSKNNPTVVWYLDKFEKEIDK